MYFEYKWTCHKKVPASGMKKIHLGVESIILLEALEGKTNRVVSGV